LTISKNRKLEIENPRISALYRQKIGGFNHNHELELFLSKEPTEFYTTELNLAKL
jgi:site-specific DNA-methyltransferase (adenine-specific)